METKIKDKPAAGPQPGDIADQIFEVVQSEKISNEGSKPELYEAWSVINNFLGCDKVPIHWYYIDSGQRRRLQYHNLIADYDKIENSEDEINCYGEYIDELFSEDEIEQLKIYLEKSHNVSLLTKRIEFPVDIINKETEFLSLWCGAMNVLNLTDDNNYNLPFKVWGQYQTYRCPPSVQLPEQELNILMKYSNELLNSMGISVPAADLENILKKLYDEYGLGANCKFIDVDGTNHWFNKRPYPRQPYVEFQFAKMLCRRFAVDMPDNAQDILDRIAETTGTYIICGNNLAKRIKLKQKYIEDQEKQEEADCLEILDATRGGTINGDV